MSEVTRKASQTKLAPSLLFGHRAFFAHYWIACRGSKGHAGPRCVTQAVQIKTSRQSHLLALSVLLLSSSWPTDTAWAIVLLDAHNCRNMCLSAAATATGEGERCASLRVVRGNSDANCLTVASCCTYECVMSPCFFVTRWPCFIFSFVTNHCPPVCFSTTC